MSGFMASGRADVRPIGGRAEGGIVPVASGRRPMGPNGPDGRFAPTERWTRLRASGHRGTSSASPPSSELSTPC